MREEERGGLVPCRCQMGDGMLEGSPKWPSVLWSCPNPALAVDGVSRLTSSNRFKFK